MLFLLLQACNAIDKASVAGQKVTWCCVTLHYAIVLSVVLESMALKTTLSIGAITVFRTLTAVTAPKFPLGCLSGKKLKNIFRPFWLMILCKRYNYFCLKNCLVTVPLNAKAYRCSLWFGNFSAVTQIQDFWF